MYCVNCGVEIGNDFSFCQSCGRPQKNAGGITEQLPSPEQGTEAARAFGLAEHNSVNAPKAMRFFESIEFSIRNYANFRGRASRSEFWYWILFCALVPICGYLVFGLSDDSAFDSTNSQELWDGLYGFFVLFILIPSLARLVRRLHDTNRSGAYLLFAFIPVIGNIILTVWFSSKGDIGANRFGPGSNISAAFTKKAVEQEFEPVTVKSKDWLSQFRLASDALIRNRKLVVAIAIAILLSLATQAHIQYGKIISSIEISEMQMLEFNEIKRSLFEAHTSGSPWSFNSDLDKSEWESSIKYESGVYQSRISNAGKSIEDVLILFWNMEHKDVRSKYLLHNSAWQNDLQSNTVDPYSLVYSDLVASTWIDFCKELKGGIPWYSFGRFDSRISKLCISDNDPGIAD